MSRAGAGGLHLRSMECGERKRLLLEYIKTARAFSDAVSYLDSRAGETSEESYEQAESDAEDHRVAVEQARLALDQHTSEHGCVYSE
jgi:hypothetical protein